MHVFPATANDCILQTNSFGLVNRQIFRPTDKNGTACPQVWAFSVIVKLLISRKFAASMTAKRTTVTLTGNHSYWFATTPRHPGRAQTKISHFKIWSQDPLSPYQQSTLLIYYLLLVGTISLFEHCILYIHIAHTIHRYSSCIITFYCYLVCKKAQSTVALS